METSGYASCASLNRLSLHMSHILQAVGCILGQQTVDAALAWHQTDARHDHKHVCCKPLTVAVRVAECNASSRCLRMCSSNMCISIALCLVCMFLCSFCAHVSVPEVRYVWSTHVGLFIQSMLVGAAAACCMRLRVGSRDQSHTVCSCLPI